MHSQMFTSVAPHFQQGVFPKLDLPAILAEKNLVSCSIEGVELYGGPLARDALAQIQEKYSHPIGSAMSQGLSPIIDVRIQRLMPGMYPSIPGWHCDAVPRSNYTGQPDFSMIVREAFHVALLLSNEPKGVSNTEYVKTNISPKIWDKEHVYQDLHRQVERMGPDTVFAKDGQFAWFTPKTIHRAKPCERRGVRMFMRFSMYHKPPVQNAVVNAQQVYILSEENGW